jgi:hypothetical protein
MSIARGVAKAIGGVIFVLALIGAITSAALADFTDYSNIKESMSNMLTVAFENQLQPDQMEQIHSTFKTECSEPGRTNVTQDFENLTATLSCSDINAVNASGIPKLLADNIIDQLYYKDYGCSYLDCIRKDMPGADKPIALIASAEANRFYSSIVLYFIIIAVAGGALLAWGSGSIPSGLRAFGWSFVTIGIGYFFIGLTKVMVPIPGELQATVSAMLDPLYATLGQYFLYSLIAGVGLLIVGYGMGFLKGKAPR